MVKSVLVVGAGPAGLVAAKTLLHSAVPGTFNVTVLEKSDRVGGLWPVDKHDRASMLRPDMRTNLSKYTVSFSDLAWSSVDICERDTNTAGIGKDGKSRVPMFPKAWHVGIYLQTYADKYIPRASIRFKSEVTSAEWIREGHKYAWRVKWTSAQNEQLMSDEGHAEGIFDYMVVATGFFAKPRNFNRNSLAATPQKNNQPKTIHSTDLRSLFDLVSDRTLEVQAEQNLVVVGGGMSGAEAAALLAMELSSVKNSPKQKKEYKAKIYHVIARPFYALPLYLPSNAAPSTRSLVNGSNAKQSPAFLPLDLVFYNLGRRTEAAIKPVSGKVQPDRAGSTHRFLQSLIGDDQSDLGSRALVHNALQLQQPPYVAISEGYAEFVRSGAIIPVYGRMTVTKEDEIIVTGGGEKIFLDNIAGIVNATGFSPHVSISWLPKEVLDILEYDYTSLRLPCLLQHNSVLHPQILNLGFVGFYEGPYWGVMEMQARVLAKKWMSAGQEDPLGVNGSINALEGTESMFRLREDMRSGDGIPQFWMGDYMGLMESFATDLGITRSDTGFGGRNGPVLPARYVDATGDRLEAERTLNDLQDTLRASSAEGHSVARAAFRAMQGSWKMKRTLTSALPNFPSGALTGTANFHPRYPTDDAFDAEYLYIEEGDLVTEQGLTMKASRRYVYRYREDTDKISAWFVKDDGKTVDYFFNEMDFQVLEAAIEDPKRGRQVRTEEDRDWVAKGSHLCIDDFYESFCHFQFRGIALHRFGIKYVVKGPRKDYVSDTWYERPEAIQTANSLR